MVVEKRKADESALVPVNKKSRNEVVASSSKNKAVTPSVSSNSTNIYYTTEFTY